MIMTQLCRIVLSALVCASLCAVVTSCTAVGPNYKRPATETPGGYKSAATRESDQPGLSRDWWKLYGDPNLTRLEEAAIAANPDLKSAMARVAQARAAARVTESQFYPVVTFDPAVTRSRTPGRSGTGNTVIDGTTVGGSSSRGNTSNNIRIPFDVSYEVDIWGRVRRLTEAALQQVRASEDDFEVVLQTLEGDVAQDYFSIRSLDAQTAILSKNVESFRKEVELTQTQQKAGLVGPIDVAQAETQLHSTIAQEVDTRRQRADLEHALAILLGRPPSEFTLANQPLDLLPPVIPAGLPADLLRRRPDVAEAEANLAAANAQVGVATAEFYPTVRLTGAAGFESVDFQHALDWENRIWSIGPSISFPIFLGGQLEANLQLTRAKYDELVGTYHSSVLSAYRDVEDSLTDLHLRADAAQAQDNAVKAAREYLRLSEVQNRGGLLPYLQVIDAERTLLTNELAAAQILNQRMVSSVLLIKALGGGWDSQHAATRPTTQAATRMTP
jgi:multidrug efflux system outer membrane protein